MTTRGKITSFLLAFLLGLAGSWEGILPPLLSADEPTIKGKMVLHIADQLTEGLPKDKERPGCYHKVYTLKMKTGRSYLVDHKSTDFDAYLRLEDSQGRQLAENDDSHEGFDSRLLFRPKKEDTYRIIATTCGDGENGRYTLTVREIIEKKVLDVKDRLTNDLPRDKIRQGSYHKVYQVKMAKGRVYAIELDSSDFDTYLRLEDAKEQDEGNDDDGGGNLNSRIIYAAAANGTYRVIVNSFEDGATGDYQLMVHEIQEEAQGKKKE